jgi:dipeptidyl aminopeptidase/acylaminoacyl peptidase
LYRPDIALLALQYPYVKPTTFGGKVRWVADVRRAAYRTVAGGMLGVSYLVQEEGLAAERITIVGTSLGSIFGALHGSLDERVSRVVLVHGGGDFPHLLRTFADRWWEVPLATLLSRVLLRSFDPVLYVSEISPRELVMIAARHDDRFPVESSRAVFDAARQPKSWIWTDSSHVRSADEALVQILVREIDRLFVPSGSSR